MIQLLAIFLQVGAFIGFALFAVLYFFRSQWASTAVGRNAMAFMVVCALLLGLSLVRLIVGEAQFAIIREPARIVSFLLVNAVVWWRVVLLIQVQREVRKRPTERHPHG